MQGAGKSEEKEESGYMKRWRPERLQQKLGKIGFGEIMLERNERKKILIVKV